MYRRRFGYSLSILSRRPPGPGTGRQFTPVTDWTKAGMLSEEVIEAQGDLMRAFWKKYDVPLKDDVKEAYGVK